MNLNFAQTQTTNSKRKTQAKIKAREIRLESFLQEQLFCPTTRKVNDRDSRVSLSGWPGWGSSIFRRNSKKRPKHWHSATEGNVALGCNARLLFAFTSWPCSRCKSEFESLFSPLLLFLLSLSLSLSSFLDKSVATNEPCVYCIQRVSAWHVSNATHRDQWTCPWPAGQSSSSASSLREWYTNHAIVGNWTMNFVCIYGKFSEVFVIFS